MPQSYEQLASGLVVPVQPLEPKPKPERVKGPLEFEHEEEIKDAGRALQILYNLTRHGGGICLSPASINKERRKLVMELSKQLLGDGVGYWEYT